MRNAISLSKIVIVEDSELLHKMYDLIFMRFRSQGTKIIHAFNGQEALTKLSENPDTDLIILDINMPVMSGLEFLQYCKRERVFQNIPVIIISTEGKEEDTLRGLKAGARGYLTKPFDATALYDLIDQVLTLSNSSPGIPNAAV
ncbi:MAG: response regulator [Nitrospirota bacterium]